ncbi:MAG: rod shape-determining protein MreD [Muribaculaceae bacterium]|jgi:rod shape-determining protein MreD
MHREVIRLSALFILMLLVQVLICNHIALFNVAVPIVFIYFIIRLPMNIGNGLLFTLSFLMGLCVDICSDTPGVNALACTLLSALRKPVFFAYVPRDDKTKNIIPSMSTLGVATYCKYLISMVGIYCLLAFTIEYFNFADVKDIVILSACSCLLTFLILLAIDCLIINRE